MSLGVMFTGGNPAEGRQEDDYYATPPECVVALLKAEKFQGGFFEPACGDGAISKVLTRVSNHVVSSDLVDRGYGTQANFLATRELPAPNILTNPPFNVAVDFIRHGLSLGPEKMALLLKAEYFHAKERYALFCEHPPAMVYPLLWRPDFLGKGRPVMSVCWFVWHKGNRAWPSYVPVPNPRWAIEERKRAEARARKAAEKAARIAARKPRCAAL